VWDPLRESGKSSNTMTTVGAGTERVG